MTAVSAGDTSTMRPPRTATRAGRRRGGLRAWKQTASGRRYFLYDGINVVCELDADGEIIAESVFGAAGLVSRGEVQYQFDPLGDAVHLLDATGELLAHRLFDAWGNELSTGITDPRGYRAQYGYYTDQETGLVARAYRYYAPGVGRFVNRDPIGFAGGVELYAYGRSRPISRADSAGLVDVDVPKFCAIAWLDAMLLWLLRLLGLAVPGWAGVLFAPVMSANALGWLLYWVVDELGQWLADQLLPPGPGLAEIGAGRPRPDYSVTPPSNWAEPTDAADLLGAPEPPPFQPPGL